jgi:hypothetical protein
LRPDQESANARVIIVSFNITMVYGVNAALVQILC